MGDWRNAYRVLVGRPEGKNHFESLGVEGRIILRWIVRKGGGMAWTGLVWLKIGTIVGTCKGGNEPLGSIKCWEFLD